MARKKADRTPEEIAEARARQRANLLTAEEVNSRLTPEEMHEKMSMMGKASAEKKKKNRMMMELARKMLEMPVSNSYTANKEIMRRFGIQEEDMTYAVAMLASMAVKGMSGDVNAAKFVRDTAGLDTMTILKEDQLEYMKENGQTINVNLDGEVTTKRRVQIYLPERDEDPE